MGVAQRAERIGTMDAVVDFLITFRPASSSKLDEKRLQNTVTSHWLYQHLALQGRHHFLCIIDRDA